MLVWKAMPSMTPMMSAIRPDDSCSSPIVETTWSTTAQPRVAAWVASLAMSLAWCAATAVLRTVLPSDCTCVAAACRFLAASSVRVCRVSLPSAMRCAMSYMRDEAPRAEDSTVRRFDCMVSTARSTRSSSSLPGAWMTWLRSPRAMRSVLRKARKTRCTMPRNVDHSSQPISASATMSAPSSARLRQSSASARARTASSMSADSACASCSCECAAPTRVCAILGSG